MKLLITLLIMLTAVSQAFNWPLLPGDQTHKIDGVYGSSNIPWEDASPSNKYGNFHSGIDLFITELTLPGEEEEVYAVKAGYITNIIESVGPEEENRIIICDTPSSSDEGWAYLHVENPYSFEKYEYIEDITEYFTYIYQEPETDATPHLHFQRSGPTWIDPTGLCNPLEYLSPSAVGEYWEFEPQPDPAEHPWFYFIKDQTISDWAQWEVVGDFYSDTLAADALEGSIDIIQGFSLWTHGDIGTQVSYEDYTVPYRIEWDCVKLGQEVDSDEIIFNRHVVSFEGSVGSMDDWEKYKQFYFRFLNLHDLFTESLVSYGDAIYITNCAETDAWNGIDNIEENSWNTALSAEGSGEAYHPPNMVTRDGRYRIDITAYAWDTNVTQDVSIECMLCNHKEIAQEVRLSDAATDQDIWHAEWIASYDTDGFKPVKNVYVNETTEPGTTLEIEIVFSGPMSNSVAAWVRFTKPEGGYIVATPGSPEWTSTNQPDGYFDTWNGTVDVPAEGFSGWMTMKIKAHDISDLGLQDPSIAYPDPPSPTDEEYTDDHHGFGIAITSEPGWPVFLEHWISGSPVAGDLDGDGDLDIA